MSNQVPAISELNIDDRRWKIDWLGAVRKDENMPLEPKIDVIVSPLANGAEWPFYEKQLIGNERRTVSIGIGQLPLLRIGSIWRNGKVLDDVAGKRLDLSEVEISDGTVSTIDSGEMMPGGNYIIPKYVCQLGRPGLGAKCLAVRYNGSPYGIVIPVTEVIRFYYAVSTRLSVAAFHGTYQHSLNEIINEKESGICGRDGVPFLVLRKIFSNDDAWIIARILCDEVALQGVSLISKSLAQAHMTSSQLFPRCGFPFIGKTDWTARGLCMKTNEGYWRYIVYELTYCTSPFPFENVRILRDNRNDEVDNDPNLNGDKKDAWPYSKTRAKTGLDDAVLQSEIDPQSGMSPVRISQANERFGAIYGKKIEELTSEYNVSKSGKIRRFPTHNTDCLSTSRGSNSGSEAGEAEIVSERCRVKGLPASLAFIPEVVEGLNKYIGVTAEVVQQEHGIFLPVLQPFKKGKRWECINDKSKTRRRIAVISISYEADRYAYFVEIEPKPQKRDCAKKTKNCAGLLSYDCNEPMPEDVFEEMLEVIVKNKGVWRDAEFERIGISCIALKHTWMDADHCARNIMERIPLL